MIYIKTFCCIVVLVIFSYILVECRSYNNGLIFYNLENHNTYLPPTISVSRGRGLAKFKYSPRGSIWSTFGKPCECEGPLCGCCVGIRVKQFKFDQKMCANVSYALARDEIQLEVFFNDKPSARYGIAARNPSPLCIPIMMGIPMSMCVQMSNIGIQGDNLNMCMDFLVRLASTELFEMHFQCMKVGLQGASWVGADGQPVIPANESKIKDKNAIESDDYYDESEAHQEENEISSKEENKELDKAEEEMDSNDITEKIMDIVKEKEQESLRESTESIEDNTVEGLTPALDEKQVGEIVTNIMDSINQANTAEDTTDALEEISTDTDRDKSDSKATPTPALLDDHKSDEDNSVSIASEDNKLDNMDQSIQSNALGEIHYGIATSENNVHEEKQKENFENSNEIGEGSFENKLDFLNQETSDANKDAVDTFEIKNGAEIVEDNENVESLSNNALKDELYLEELFENIHQQEMENQEKEFYTKKPDLVPEESTKQISGDLEPDFIKQIEILTTAKDTKENNELSKNDIKLNNNLQMLQQIMDTSTEHLMAANLKPTTAENAKTASEMDNAHTKNNVITTTTTKTTTNKPTKLDNNLASAAAFIENTDGIDKNNNDNDDYNDNDNDNDDQSEEEDEGHECDGGDNGHENDSDYEDEESEEEAADETAEKEIQSSDAMAIVMPTVVKFNSNRNGSSTKESTTTQELANESSSNESYSNDETNNEMEIEEEEVFSAADKANQNGFNDLHENEAEEEYDGEYEDYEATTIIISDKTINGINSTCCKSVFNITYATANQQLNDNNKNYKLPQIDTTASDNRLQFVDNNNSMISNTNNVNKLVSATNKMSQIIGGSAAVSTLAPALSNTISSIAMPPLPLARKLFALYHQQH